VNYSIGLDVGGTKISAALVQKDKILEKIKMPTESEKGRPYVLKKITEAVDSLLKNVDKAEVVGIGVGFPGLVDVKTGTILKAPNVPGWNNFSIQKFLESKFKLKTYLANDVRAMALGEKNYGAGKNYKNVICLTVGTGLGGAVIINNELYCGKGNAGEIGHIIIVDDGELCGCGNKGCLEAYVSSRGINRESKKVFGKVLPPLDIEDMARKGNAKAIRVYATLGRYLGVGIATLTSVLDPEVVIVGGGIAHAGKYLLGPAVEELKKRSINRPPKVVQAEFGKDAGVIGAAHLPIMGGLK